MKCQHNLVPILRPDLAYLEVMRIAAHGQRLEKLNQGKEITTLGIDGCQFCV